MKKTLIMLSSLAVVFLMVSTVTAVPQSSSNPLMNAIDKMEGAEQELTEATLESASDGPSGVLGKIIDLIKLLIDLIMNLITIVQSILSIVALIQAVFNAIKLVMDLIQQIMDLIQDPSATI